MIVVAIAAGSVGIGVGSGRGRGGRGRGRVVAIHQTSMIRYDGLDVTTDVANIVVKVATYRMMMLSWMHFINENENVAAAMMMMMMVVVVVF